MKFNLKKIAHFVSYITIFIYDHNQRVSHINFKYIFHLLLRHGLVSGTCATSEFLLFMLMYTYLQLNLFVSFAVSFLSATLIGFIGHSMFTFKLGRLFKRNAILFSVQASCALILGYLVVSSLIDAGFQPAVAKANQLVLIFFFNAMFGKMITFKFGSNK
jgi:putative flippase GtrA